MSLARLKSAQEASLTEGLKQQSILSSAKKKVVFHTLTGPKLRLATYRKLWNTS
jgi:hypothetical protein